MEETTEDEDFLAEGRGKVTEDELKSAWNMVMLDSMVTHLPFNIYVVECQMTDNPLSVFIPSDYNDPEYYFAVTVSDDPAFVDPHTLLDVKLEAVDIQNAFRFIRHYEKYIRDFAKVELSVLDANYNAIHKGYTPVSKSYLIQRPVEVMSLNEMANVQKNKTGLPCDVWIDFNGSWQENTGHAYRFKVTDSKNKRKLSVTIPDLEFVNGTGSFQVPIYPKSNIGICGMPTSLSLQNTVSLIRMIYYRKLSNIKMTEFREPLTTNRLYSVMLSILIIL